MVQVEVVLRTGKESDLVALAAIDTVATRDSQRVAAIERWLRTSSVVVAEIHDQPVGYATLDYGFFGRPQLGMLMVKEDLRGRAIGQLLLKEVERRLVGGKLFATTNQSNNRMHRLLTKNGYKICGFVEELDPGDPEIVYFKLLG